MMNSCDAVLAKQINKKFEDLAHYEQGGITYIKIALDKMFTISNTVVTPLQEFFENFAKEGIAKVGPMRMFVWLPNRSLPSLNDLLKYLLYQLNVQFKYWKGSPNALLIFSGKLLAICWLVNVEDSFIHFSVCLSVSLHESSRLVGIKKLCKKANDMFNSLNVSKEWNIPQKHRTDACFNCGDPDHGVHKCPKPIDQVRIDNAKSEFSKHGGGRGGRGGRNRNMRGHGRGCDSGRGRGVSDKAYNRGKWNNNSKATNASVGNFGGIGKHKGKWSVMRKSCGWNTTHTTGFHESSVEDPSSFSLPATHVFWTKSGRTPFIKEPRSSIPSVAAQPVAINSNLLSS
jgi:hypothetical protein